MFFFFLNRGKVDLFWEGQKKSFCMTKISPPISNWKSLMYLYLLISLWSIFNQNSNSKSGRNSSLPNWRGWILKVLCPSLNMWALLVQWLKLKYRNHLGKQGLIERLLISFSVAGLIKQRSLRQTLGKLEKEKFHSLHPSNEGSWSEPIFCTHLKIKLDSLGWLFWENI